MKRSIQNQVDVNKFVTNNNIPMDIKSKTRYNNIIAYY